MKEYYSQFTGLNRTVNAPDAPQVSFLVLENCLNNRLRGGIVKRPGSASWSATGDILGVAGYSKDSGSYRVPNVLHPVRHRRNGGTSFIERLNWSTDAWVAITQGANTSFGTAGIMQVAQYGAVLCVCAGKPARITDITGGNVNRLGGSAPSSAPTVGVVGGTLTGTARMYYTLYDSTTGWESSPSAITTQTVTAQDFSWSALQTTADREGVDKKRLYRTQLATEGAAPFYRVTEITLATTTYADSVTDANLGAQGPDIGDHDAPPTTSYICAEYANCFWIATGNELWYSKAYDGTNVSLEYFSSNRKFYFPKQITGLAYSPEFGKLLVFVAAGSGIHQISGRSESTFAQDIFKHTEGTNFPMSVSIHESNVAYWGANGPTIITNSGIVHTFAEDMKDLFRAIAIQEYNSDVYVWSVWHPVYNKFIFGFAATDTGSSSWSDVVTGIDVDWYDTSSGATIGWDGGGGSGGITRQVIFTISPNEGISETVSFAQVVDGNSTLKAFTCAYVPPTKGAGINLMQETLFLGTTAATGVTLQALRDDKSMDGSEAIAGKIITQRIDPASRAEANGRRDILTKRYKSLYFDKTNPMSLGATVQWTKDVDPIRDAMITWTNFVGSNSDLVLGFQSGLAEWVHLKIEDSTNYVNIPLLSAFAVDFYLVGGREGAQS